MNTSEILVLDFDGTLITRDSLWYLCFSERLFLHPKIFFYGISLAIHMLLVPKKMQIAARRRFKYELIKSLEAQNNRIELYAKHLAESVNTRVVALANQYDSIYIFSASWEPLVRSCAELLLPREKIKGVYATKMTRDPALFKVIWSENKLSGLAYYQIDRFDLVTDSYDDLPLMKRAKKVIMIP